MEPEFGPVTEQDIQDLLADLLPADRREILAMGFEPEWAVRNSVRSSQPAATAARINGKLICLVGLSRTNDLWAAPTPWLVSTTELFRNRKAVLKYSKLFLHHWLRSEPVLTNYVDARHTRAVRWLSWLGARMEHLPSFGPYSRPFYRFTFEASDVH